MIISAVSAFALRQVGSGKMQAENANGLLASGPADERRQRRQFYAILGLLFVVAAGTSVFTRLETYFAANALSNSGARTAVLVSIALGGAAGQPLWIWVRRHICATNSLRASATVLAVGAILFLLSAGENVVLASVSGMIYGCGAGGLSTVLWAAFADIVAIRRSYAGAPSPSLAFGMLTFSHKLASAFCITGIGYLLQTIDYHSGRIAASSALLGPMAGAPLIGALICFATATFAAPRTHAGKVSQPSAE